MHPWIGLLFWVLLFYPAWSPWCVRLRKRAVSGNAHPTVTQEDRGVLVSRADEVEADLDTWGVGPNWVQDEPYPELFEDEDS